MRRSLLLFVLGFTSLAHAEPWYQQERCFRSMASVFDADFLGAEPGLLALERDPDLDAQSCAIWVRTVEGELKVAIFGATPELLENRLARVQAMLRFSERQRAAGLRFADFEIEARMRLVRVLLQRGEQSAALAEAKHTKVLLAQRGQSFPTPTSAYARGVINLALAYEPWAVRTVLKLAGLSGELATGQHWLASLLTERTVYRDEATYVARHFAESHPDGVFGRPSQYSGQLAIRYPRNPQFGIDYASDLLAERRFQSASEAIRPLVAQVHERPELWSNKLRAQIFWIGGRSALSLGDRTRAKLMVQLSRRERYDDLRGALEDLESQL